MPRAVIIANPFAGTDRNRLDGPRSARMLEPLGYDVRIEMTQHCGHAVELAAAAAQTCDLVVAVGGDGTVHEVAKGLVGTGCPMGVLPSGSGNDFAQGIGCPTVGDGLDAIARGSDQAFDVCAIDGKRFINSVGVLASGLISGRASRLWRWLGRGRYILASAGVLLSYRGQDVTWRFSNDGTGDTVLTGRYLLAEVCNGPSTGGGFRLAPDADPCDGLLDVCLVEPVSALTGLGLLPAAAKGERLEHAAISRIRGSRIEFEMTEKVAWHRDGEAGWLSAGRHVVEVLPEKLLVRVLDAFSGTAET